MVEDKLVVDFIDKGMSSQLASGNFDMYSEEAPWNSTISSWEECRR